MLDMFIIAIGMVVLIVLVTLYFKKKVSIIKADYAAFDDFVRINRLKVEDDIAKGRRDSYDYTVSIFNEVNHVQKAQPKIVKCIAIDINKLPDDQSSFIESQELSGELDIRDKRLVWRFRDSLSDANHIEERLIKLLDVAKSI